MYFFFKQFVFIILRSRSFDHLSGFPVLLWLSLLEIHNLTEVTCIWFNVVIAFVENKKKVQLNVILGLRGPCAPSARCLCVCVGLLYAIIILCETDGRRSSTAFKQLSHFLCR